MKTDLHFQFPFAEKNMDMMRTRTCKHGQGHRNMDKDMETWTRTWKHARRGKHGRGHGNMDEDMAISTGTWEHGQ
jgi:hypothetical protein